MMEKDFIERLQKAEAYIPGDYDMEIDHIDDKWFV